MKSKNIIKKIKHYAQEVCETEPSGHDFYHLQRVVNTAKMIQKKEGGDLFLIESAAWLHDVYDYKVVKNEMEGKQKLIQFLETLSIENHQIESIITSINQVSFRGGLGSAPTTIEAKIVQDADRLDALGAIGIARTFAYGGKKGNSMHRPLEEVKQYATIEAYKNSNSTTINHFYEKLFLLKDLMNTKTAKKMALERHRFMEDFITQFMKEWNK